MKVCKYCGTENDSSASVCSRCGANEFKYKCNNCGTIFEEGRYCPKCGIKEGTKAKYCPNCGTQYFTTACPNCGYTGHKIPANPAPVAQPQKKRKTWLWVLGWIFCFPIPLTILILRNEKWDKKLRYGIVAALWIIFLLIGIFGEPNKNVNNNIILSENKIENEESMISEIDKNIFYDKDEIVNYFITEYNKKEIVPIVNIEQGNIKSKAFGYIGETRIEMLNAYDAAAESFNIKIYGGNTDEKTELMFETFKKIVGILDPNITKDEIENTIATWKENNVLVENEKIGTLTITFVPSIELSYGRNDSRIDIATSDYAK